MKKNGFSQYQRDTDPTRMTSPSARFGRDTRFTHHDEMKELCLWAAIIFIYVLMIPVGM